MSQSASAGGQPTSYKTNVNRAKTKRWVEAKSYSYDGDDWGEVDDYDEYGGYDEPPPAPRPTGLRQQGQSATQMPQDASAVKVNAQQPLASHDRPMYGNMGAPHLQQQYGGRSVTSPQPPQQQNLGRSNSFDRNDDRRAFSAGIPPQNIGNAPPGQYGATPMLQGQAIATHDHQSGRTQASNPGQPQQGTTRVPVQVPNRQSMDSESRQAAPINPPGPNYRGSSYIEQPRSLSIDSRTQSMTSNNSRLDFHDRRDFSPSALPPPLHTRGSPSPDSRLPPRKSSLSQMNSPTLPYSPQAPPVSTSADSQNKTPLPRERAGSPTEKVLPFVRPADIYRRMEEEKEKERQSQDSARPSMDAIMGRPSERPSLDSKRDSESGQRLKPKLDPVTERKSEYGFEGANVDNQVESKEKRPTTSKRFEIKRPSSTTTSTASKSSLGPMLPDVARISGFGDSFLGSSGGFGDEFSSHFGFANPSAQAELPVPLEIKRDSNLQHQPSLGFTSAVHQAFDTAEEQVPPTPSSTANSTVGRSASGGTSTVSPIMSRGPSTATQERDGKMPSIDDVTTPIQNEETGRAVARPISASSLGTPTQVTRKTTPSQTTLPQAMNDPPSSFIPGYRRNSGTPSPDNSPARTPALDAYRHLRHPQEVELATATPTPTETESSANASFQDSDHASPEDAVAKQTVLDHLEGKDEPATGSEVATASDLGKPGQMDSPISPTQKILRHRTDSSGSGRVRSLADKFESGSRPGSAHSTTPRASVLGANVQKKDDLAPPRPLNDRVESFRPQLPGGWESSASIAPVSALGKQELVNKAVQGRGQIDVQEPPTALADKTETTSSVSHIKDASEEAFAAVATAGSALAGAFAAAAGMNQTSSDDSVSATPAGGQGSHGTVSGQTMPTRDRTTSVDTTLQTDASKPHMLSAMEDEASTAAPTPLPKDTPQPVGKGATPAYFPASDSGDVGVTEHAINSQEPISSRQPSSLPPLRTEMPTQQYESDRLRREIVRELTPNISSEPTTAGSESLHQLPSRHATDQSESRHGRESGVLPKEYDSYWNDDNSESESSAFSAEPGQVEDATTAKRQQGAAVVSEPFFSSRKASQVPVEPVATSPRSEERPHILPHRFSWEKPLQDLSTAPPIQQPQPASQDVSQTIPIPTSGATVQRSTESGLETHQVTGQMAPLATEMGYGSDDDQKEAVEQEKALPRYPGGLELAQPSAEKPSSGSPSPDNAERLDDSSLQSQGQQPRMLKKDLPIEAAIPVMVRDDELPPPPLPADAQPKIPAFREILALKEPSERIRAYNHTREQFANLNTGLAHWLAITSTDLPEHAYLLSSQGQSDTVNQSHKPSPSRSKLGALLPSGTHSGQQPYYQQYLNASPQTSAPDGRVTGGAIGGGVSQGFSPSGGSGGKMSSQQVQAKSKELLHTAGVFGGKANVAAKGLFSKGKSKLKSSGGTEKAPLLFAIPASSPDPVNRGMQMPRETVNTPPHDCEPEENNLEHKRPESHAPYSEPQNSTPASTQGSERDTTSVGSSSQGQLGDDERSEGSTTESQPNNVAAPQSRESVTISDRQRQSVQSQSVDGENIANTSVLRGALTGGSYNSTPTVIQSPRSTTSSNKTPTQANFDQRSDFPNAPLVPERTQSPQELRSGPIYENVLGASPRPFSPPMSRYWTQSPGLDVPANMPMDSHVPRIHPDDIYSQNSERNQKTAKKAAEPSANLANLQSRPAGKPDAEKQRLAGESNRLAAAQSSMSQRPASLDTSKGVLVSSAPSPLVDESTIGPRESQDYQRRGLSFDSIPSRIDPNRPPSPLSSQQAFQPLNHGASQQRGRTVIPVHHGIDYDFGTESETERARRRSPSFSRPFQTSRSSEDSRPFREPDLQDHPAFRQSSEMTDGREVPTHFYPGQISREEALMPRQQASEYQLEGVGPPDLPPPSENSRRSRRGSRSSAFFKSLSGSASKPDSTPLPTASGSQANASSVTRSAEADKNGKRSSIFRHRVGQSEASNDRTPAKESNTPGAATDTFTSPAPAMRMHDEEEFPLRAKQSSSSRLSKRLQRASTSGNPEQQDSGKKRFSAIGSLFGRAKQKTQSSSEHARVVSQQSPPRHTQGYVLPPTVQQTSEHGFLKESYSPHEGFYAPARIVSPQIRQPESIPAYIQDLSLRQRSPPQVQAQGPLPSQTSIGFLRRTSQQSSSSAVKSDTVHGSKTRRSATFRPQHESNQTSSSWSRFSANARSKSRHSQAAPPANSIVSLSHIDDSVDSPSYDTPNLQPRLSSGPLRSDSPPPPAPPPKDHWHRPHPRQSTSGSNSFGDSIPAQIPLQEEPHLGPKAHRQLLPSLQTNIPRPNQSPVYIKTERSPEPKNALSPAEKRKSRQQEIETGHLSATSPSSAGRNAVPTAVEEVGDEEIVMSATSFPGQEWQPSYAHFDDA